MGRCVDASSLGLALVAETEHEPFEMFREHVLAHLDALLPADLSLFLPFDASFAGTAPESLRRFSEEPRYWRDLGKAFEAGSRDEGAYVDTEVFSARERDRLAFFREVIRPQGISSMVVAIVNYRGGATGVIHVARTGRGRPFTSHDLARALPYLRVVGALHQTMQEPIDPGAGDGVAALTPREREVAELAASGYQNLAIAARLGTSPNTVRHQLEAVFRKCGVGNRAELAALLPQRRGAARAYGGVMRRVDAMLRAR